MVRCKNCGDAIVKKYCPSCGQAIEQRLNFRRALEDTMRGITNGDSGVLLTLKELCIRPGKMIAEYLEGRRIVHFRPFPLLILLTGLVTLFDEWIQSIHITTEEAAKIAKENIEGVAWFETTPVWAMAFIPAFALASWVLFRKKYNLVEHAYITAFTTIQRQMIFFLFLSIMNLLIAERNPAKDTIESIVYVIVGALIFGYTYWDYKQIFNLSRWATLWRVVMIFAIGGVLIVLTFSLAITFTVLADWVVKYADKLESV